MCWRWAGVDSAWEQEKLEVRKMLENAAESPASSVCARAVSQPKREQDHAWNLQRRLDTDYQVGDVARKINATIANIRLVTSSHAICPVLIPVSLDSF
jgi:hypothetical protein